MHVHSHRHSGPDPSPAFHQSTHIKKNSPHPPVPEPCKPRNMRDTVLRLLIKALKESDLFLSTKYLLGLKPPPLRLKSPIQLCPFLVPPQGTELALFSARDVGSWALLARCSLRQEKSLHISPAKPRGAVSLCLACTGPGGGTGLKEMLSLRLGSLQLSRGTRLTLF